MMWIRALLGLALTAAAFILAGRRLARLYRIGRRGQPADPGRTQGWSARIRAELTEVLGHRKLLAWSGPGIAHLITFWAFVVLGFTLIESYGALFDRDFHIPLIGTSAWLGFTEDLLAVATLAAVAVFAGIRRRHSPAREGRDSRFFGSHLDAAWLVLFMVFNVIWSLLLYRAAQINTGNFPYPKGAFASAALARLLRGLGYGMNSFLETAGLLVAIAVVLGFLVLVVHSKHLHIFAAPANVAFSRRPRALGALLPVYSRGIPVDFDDPGEDDRIGRGTIADFTWKGLLDFASCTECGRCQSQCPAWNTGKPLSPKLVIMGLRDHALAQAPYLLGGSTVEPTALVGDVIDPDVLWSCTTCGACVEQCPVDIEHVDHIVDMRRYQVLIESAFPAEAGVLLRNLEHAGDPWGRGARARTEWTRGLDFPVRVLDGAAVPDEVEYLFWVGCAGAFDDRGRRTSRAVAELLHTAGVEFAILGEGETCTGDPARRIGHEYLFQTLARSNVDTLNEAGVRTIVATCAHCFNTLANEYPQLGGNYDVVHHTQLLARLVETGRLTPMVPIDATVTYHDPCYLGRHNRVFSPPRELLAAVPGLRLTEPPRNRERSFCCGAGGARMWLEEKIGTRINETRVDELLGGEPDLIAAACPYCIDMLGDGLALRAHQDVVDDHVEVTDVSEILLRSVRPAEVPQDLERH
jgi:Fe-S oxidoreductase